MQLKLNFCPLTLHRLQLQFTCKMLPSLLNPPDNRNSTCILLTKQLNNSSGLPAQQNMNSEVIKHGRASVKWNKKSFWQGLDLGLGCWMCFFSPFPFKVDVPYFMWSTSCMTAWEEMQAGWVNAFGVKMDSQMKESCPHERWAWSPGTKSDWWLNLSCQEGKSWEKKREQMK